MNVKPKKYRDLIDEEWREIPNSNGIYWVRSHGRVKPFYYKKGWCSA